MFRFLFAVAYALLSLIIFCAFVLISLIWHLKPFKLIEYMLNRSIMDEIDDEINNIYKILNGTFKINDEN